MRDQRGGIVTSWLIRLVVVLVAVGLVAFDVGAVVVAKVGVDGTAETAALEAATIYGTTRNVAAARAEAEKKAALSDAKVVSFGISRDGSELTLTLERIAKTMFLQRLGGLKKWRIARATRTKKVS